MLYRYLLLICSFSIAATIQSQTAYEKEIALWKQQRLHELKSDNGWLNLAGLFWLHDGKQFFGGSVTDDIRFPIPSFPERVGYFEKNGNTVKQVIEKDIALQTNGVFQKEAIVFSADSLRQPVMSFASFRWSFLQREDRIGIRFRNLHHPAVQSLTEIPCYQVDTVLRVQAKLVRPFIQTKVGVQNVLGQTIQMVSPGKLYFSLLGQDYSLDALQEDDKLFIVFGDATSGKTTYTAGRFLYAEMPGEDGITILDFNKSFNPPCAFTPYATCVLPPPQNILPVAITAGEMKAGDH